MFGKSMSLIAAGFLSIVFILIVTPAGAQSSLTITADKTNLSSGECTTIRFGVPSGWKSVSYTNFSAAKGQQGRAFSGSATVCPKSTTTYQVEAQFSNWFDMKTVTVRVSSPQPPAPTPQPQPKTQPQLPSGPTQLSFSVDQDTITQGDCANLRWDIEGVQAVYLNGQGVTGHETRRVCPSSTTTYTLRVVTNDGRVGNGSVTVNVIAAPVPQYVPQQPQQQQVPRSSGTARIVVNKARIQLGEQYQVCFSLPSPGYVEIFVTFEDGSESLAYYGDDDGSGGCIPGTASQPEGKRRLNLVLTSSDNIVIATAETNFQVVAMQPLSPTPSNTSTIVWPTITPTDTPTSAPTNTPTDTPTSTPTNTPTATPKPVPFSSGGIPACSELGYTPGLLPPVSADEPWCTDYVYSRPEEKALRDCWGGAYPDAYLWEAWARETGPGGKSAKCPNMKANPSIEGQRPNMREIHVGDVAVWHPNCDSADKDVGHVAYVTGVHPDTGTIDVDESHWGSGHRDGVKVEDCMSFFYLPPPGQLQTTPAQPPQQSPWEQFLGWLKSWFRK